MMQTPDLDSILDLLKRQQAALSSQASGSVERLDAVHAELNKHLLNMQPLGRRAADSVAINLDRRKTAEIAQMLLDNRTIMLRLSDNNRRALETIFNTQPLIYSR